MTLLSDSMIIDAFSGFDLNSYINIYLMIYSSAVSFIPTQFDVKSSFRLFLILNK